MSATRSPPPPLRPPRGRFAWPAVALFSLLVAGAGGAAALPPAAHRSVPSPGRAAPHPAGGLSLAAQVTGHLGRLYVDPDRVVPAELVAGALLGLERQVPEATATIDAGGARGSLDVAGEALAIDLERVRSLDDAATAIDRMAAFVAARAARPRDGEDPAYAAIRGALETLDPHTRVFTPADRQGFDATTQGSFGGIGVTFDPAPRGILVREVLPGTPAARAGIAAGDLITAVGAVPLAGLGPAEVRDLVRGPLGSTVVLTVSRGGSAAPEDRPLVRELIRERSVRARLLREGGAPVLHVALERFQADTAAQLQGALATAGEEPAGIVLDLRGNPGGLLDQALAVADLFLDRGVILSTSDRAHRRKEYRASEFGVVRPQPPLVALINRGSASAAEVLAAALQPSRGLLVGETSFGKGSVQRLQPLADGGGLLLTVEHYQTPGGVSIQARGVEPDVLVRTVVVGERVVLGGPSAHAREAGLPHAFSRPAVAAGGGGAPLWELPALRTSLELYPGPGGGAPAGEARGDGHAEDVALRAALAIVREAARAGGPAGRAGLLAAAGAVLPALAAEEGRRVETALAGQGVDWSAGPEETGANLLAELPPSLLLRPGESTRVTIRVRNAGAAAAHRVWGRTASANPALANLDFAFGLIPPGEAREASAEVSAPRWSWGRWDTFDLALRQGGAAAGTFSGRARTGDGVRPALSYSVRVADENALDPRLDRDGLLARGERVRLLVRVSGSGDPGDLALRVSPDSASGLAIARRESPVGDGAGGREASFDGLLAGEGAAASVRLGVSLASRSFGPVITDGIDLPIGAPYPAALERRPPLVAAVTPVPERTEDADLALEIAVSDETAVQDVYVLVGGRKVLYRRGGGASRLRFGLRVALVPGSNRVEVVARDGDDLTTRQTYFVYRAPGAP